MASPTTTMATSTSTSAPTSTSSFTIPNAEASYDLSIATLVIYILVVPVGLFNLYKHRLNIASGYFFLTVYCILQIVGSGMIISAGSGSFSETGSIVSSIGTSPLLIGTFSVLSSAVENSPLGKSFPFETIPATATHGISIGAAVLTAVGASNIYSAPPGTPPSSTDVDLAKAGSLIFVFLVAYVFILSVLALGQFSYIRPARPLLGAVFLSLPILTIRIAETVLAYWDMDNSTFSFLGGNIAVKVCMQFLPGLFVELLLNGAGLATPVLHTVAPNKGSAKNGDDYSRDAEAGYGLKEHAASGQRESGSAASAGGDQELYAQRPAY